jgi:hypothetical protein
MRSQARLRSGHKPVIIAHASRTVGVSSGLHPGEADVTDDEREDVLQLLANYENMARAVESLVHYLKREMPVNLQAARYQGPVQDIVDLVPVWRNYAASIRVKFMLDRRAVPRPVSKPFEP